MTVHAPSRHSPRVADPFLSGIRAPLATLVSTTAVGVLFCMVLALMLGQEPLELILAIAEGAWGNDASAVATLAKVTPLLLTGLAVAMAWHAGLLNIGGEGQLTLGALASATFAVHAAFLPPFLLVPGTLLAGALTGGIWAYPAVWLRHRRGVHEVITTLLLNYVAIHMADFLVRGPLGDGSAMARTPLIPDEAAWPHLLRAGSLGLTAAPPLVLFLSIIAQIWLSRTLWGFEVKASGSNPSSARAAGVPVTLWQKRVFVLSGMLAGMAGALEVVAVHHRFYASFSPGYGFDGITVAFLADNAPGWLWLSGLLLAGLRSTDKWLQLALGVSPSVILIIQAVLLLAVACRNGWGDMGRWLVSLKTRFGILRR